MFLCKLHLQSRFSNLWLCVAWSYWRWYNRSLNGIYKFHKNAKFHQKPIPVSLILNLDMVTLSCLFVFLFVCLVTSLKKVDHHVTRRDLQVLMQSMDCSNDPKRCRWHIARLWYTEAYLLKHIFSKILIILKGAGIFYLHFLRHIKTK